jgi:hypothetical protein
LNQAGIVEIWREVQSLETEGYGIRTGGACVNGARRGVVKAVSIPIAAAFNVSDVAIINGGNADDGSGIC